MWKLYLQKSSMKLSSLKLKLGGNFFNCWNEKMMFSRECEKVCQFSCEIFWVRYTIIFDFSPFFSSTSWCFFSKAFKLFLLELNSLFSIFLLIFKKPFNFQTWNNFFFLFSFLFSLAQLEMKSTDLNEHKKKMWNFIIHARAMKMKKKNEEILGKFQKSFSFKSSLLLTTI